MKVLLYFKCYLILGILLNITERLDAQGTNASLFHEQGGLIMIEMEDLPIIHEDWQLDANTPGFTGSGYLSWKGEQYLDSTGVGQLVYPIYIQNPGKYQFTWRMSVGKGADVTDHNDTWLKITADRFYGQKEGGHQVYPRPLCEKSPKNGVDCPNGNSRNGFFKVYGQDFNFVWQAATSDHDGHILYAEFDRPGTYQIILNARSSFCQIDRMVLFHTDSLQEVKATQLSNPPAPFHPIRTTNLSIKGNQFYINDTLTYHGQYYKNQKIEGLLFNARLVQGIFDDLNPTSRNGFAYPDTKIWDPNRNTKEFIAAMPSWYEHGMLAFTLNLQGGSPLGYGNKNWVNSTFTPTGELRPEYMQRLRKILDKADELGMIVILGYFYFGQDQHLENEASVINAVDQMTDWILKKGYRNILVEVNNECDIFYDHEILKAPNIHQLIHRIQTAGSSDHRLLVSTSFSGGKIPTANVVQLADYLLLHGNGVEDPTQLAKMVKQTKMVPGYTNKPILFNEDDHYDFEEEVNHFKSAISAYASWGYFDFRRDGEAFENGFQSVPVDWRINSKRKIDFFNMLKQVTGK